MTSVGSSVRWAGACSMTDLSSGAAVNGLPVFATVNRTCGRDSARRSAVRIRTRALGVGTSPTVTGRSSVPHGLPITGAALSSSDVSGELPDLQWVVRDSNPRPRH